MHPQLMDNHHMEITLQEKMVVEEKLQNQIPNASETLK